MMSLWPCLVHDSINQLAFHETLMLTSGLCAPHCHQVWAYRFMLEQLSTSRLWDG